MYPLTRESLIERGPTRARFIEYSDPSVSWNPKGPRYYEQEYRETGPIPDTATSECSLDFSHESQDKYLDDPGQDVTHWKERALQLEKGKLHKVLSSYNTQAQVVSTDSYPPSYNSIDPPPARYRDKSSR